MATKNSISAGDTVLDTETPVYEVLEVIERPASEVEALPEVKERGHTIHESQTVAERNPSYPADDIVVRLSREGRDRDILWPISRVTTECVDCVMALE